MKNKVLVFASILLLGASSLKAQMNVGASTAPAASAMLQVSGTTKGFLPPLLTTSQEAAITSPATGLVVFNTTTNQMEVNTGTPGAPVWTGTNIAAATNIYNSNGILTANRTVSQAGFSLGFTGGNVGIGTATPGATLEVNGKTKTTNLQVTAGSPAIGSILSSADALGNLQYTSLTPNSQIAAFQTTASQTLLSGQYIGNTSNVNNLSIVNNSIPGLSLSGNVITIPVGTYSVVVSYEFTNASSGTAPSSGVLINSYFVDFPNGSGGTFRVHSNQPSNFGPASNHSAQWTTTIKLTSAATWTVALGRGQGGNYSNGVNGGTGQIDLVGTSSTILLQKLQ